MSPVPFIIIINGEVINLNTKINSKIIGYPIPSQKGTHKLSQYADDTNFFVLTGESITEVPQFFKKHEKATGATINIFKTKILPLEGTTIHNLDKKIKGMIQILGIIFIDDLKITNTLNWNNCTQEIEKQTQQLSRRHLS